MDKSLDEIRAERMREAREKSVELTVRLLLDIYRYGKQTINELSIRYGVSKRTVWRKIDILSTFIPLYEELGRNGGICIMDDFKIEKERI